MSKKDIKLLITGAIALFLACFMAIVTIVLFGFKLGNKVMEYDWKGTFGQLTEQVQNLGDN
ncbi:MAG: hypothetical protein MJ098_00860 [Saccharofermentans sp.]|nr:hypothetical protein [Saccharofermentans sp.]